MIQHEDLIYGNIHPNSMEEILFPSIIHFQEIFNTFLIHILSFNTPFRVEKTI
jgi:hypothetical protein